MKAIVAVDKEWGIGKKNGLLFKLPKDLAHFKNVTTGKVVVMGSNTLLSLPGSKPLPERTNIVLFPGGEKRDDCTVVDSLDALRAELKKYDKDEVFIIGGAMLYRTMLPYCSEVYVTKVDAVGGAEVFYENLDKSANWECVKVGEPRETNGYTIRYTLYKNNNALEF